MINLRLFKPAFFMLFAASIALLSACKSTTKEEENASVVNVEKGVTSPIWTSEGGSSHMQNEELPAGLNLKTEEDSALAVVPEEGAGDPAGEPNTQE